MTESTEQVENVEVDYKTLYEKAQADIEKIAAKKDELYKETKKAKADREAAEHSAMKAAEEKAQKDGEFEKLWQTAKKEKDELHQRLLDIQNSNRKEKIQIAAMRVATELADGDNAELLSDFVQRSLDKMADEAGALSADVLEAVKSEFKESTKYKSLLRASKAMGGGAAGNTRSASEDSKTVERATFTTWNPAKQMSFIKAGGRLI